MKRIRGKIGKPSPGVILGVIAIVLALTGTAVAAHLRLGDFDQSSRDRLAGTGVIQYAQQAHTTGSVSPTTVQTFTVTCELKKKATAGGFKWNTPPPVGSFQLIDAGPIGNGFRVRLYVLEPTAANQGLTVTSNCVKSRVQRGTPPS